MNTEISAVLAQDGRLVEWAEAVKFNGMNLNGENKDISEAMDAFLKEGVGRNGADPNHEISELIRKAITPEVVSTPSAVIDAMFVDDGTIGEFDDTRFAVAPKNTIQVYDSIPGGNVNRSFVDFTNVAPSWVNLQAETDVSLQEIRRGGYRTVANLITYIRDAMEHKKIAALTTAIDSAILSSHPGYITESGTMPTDTSMKALALYLMDVADETSEMPVAFGLNKYMQTVAGLTGATTYLTDVDKTWYNQHGLLKQYAGMALYGYSGQKRLADGSYLVPNQRIFGVAGKVGHIVTRGETNVYQETDINSEKIHIKVNGYTFGYGITDLSKVGKIVLQ